MSAGIGSLVPDLRSLAAATDFSTAGELTRLPDWGAILLGWALLTLVLSILYGLKLWNERDAVRTDLETARRVKEMAGVAWLIYDFERASFSASESLCQLLGAPAACDPTHELQRFVGRQALSQILATFRGHRADTEPYIIEFEMAGTDEPERVLRAKVLNEYLPNGTLLRASAAVRDVTEEYFRVQRMEEERIRAIKEAEMARRLADTDPLTGLPNRRQIMRELDCAIVDARKHARPLSLVVFDIDKFKLVNDTHGHQVGDAVLRRVAEIASDQTRDADTVGRIGGEEFAWLLLDSNAQKVEQAAERLRWAIEMRSGASDIPGVTISAGFARIKDNDTSLTLFARADEALYAAKRSGRNAIQKAA